jgi:hypothetical protein
MKRFHKDGKTCLPSNRKPTQSLYVLASSTQKENEYWKTVRLDGQVGTLSEAVVMLTPAESAARDLSRD